MGYYIRVLGTSDPDIHVDRLISGLAKDGLAAEFQFDENEGPERWTVLDVANPSGDVLTQIERNPVADGKLGKEELDEFREEIEGCEPSSAANWLGKYFDQVKVIYAFQLLNASMEDENFPIVSSIKTTIWNQVGGILQADNEGFSNEVGYHILWQFADDVTGAWSMAVRNFFGNWVSFKMDLGNLDHRRAFKAGKVPKTAVRL